jgi:hypothetical protein
MEMMAGRAAIGMANFKPIKLAQWADEGERWLREHVKSDDLEYETSWDVDKLEITLHVYRMFPPGDRLRQHILQVTEKADKFVSHLTVTKILLLA